MRISSSYPRKRVSSILAACLLLAVNFAQAQTKTEQLNKLNKTIENLATNIIATHHRQRTLQQQLKENEVVAGKLVIELQKTEHKLDQQYTQLKKLNINKIEYRNLLAMQQNNLAQQIRATYMLGNQTYLKLLLNHQDPNRLSRIFAYYNYLQKSRIRSINQINKTLQELHENKSNTMEQTKNLSLLKQRQQQEYRKLITSKQQHIYLLHGINLQLKTQQQKLNKLLADKQALEKVIAQLKASIISADFAAPLNQLHEKLHWPVKGKIEDLYGSQIEHSQLKWDGVIIRAIEGQNVYAISSGRVVFAQWLQGYGLLLIINHGHGYMSLYGRNNSLYKQVGDIVQPGDAIATVGQSGGYNYPSLYFAIRHNGKPVDPKLWCS
jgi:septal ring factor EnvC (AmiA/AmiB activator)